MAAMVAGMESERRDAVIDAITASLISSLSSHARDESLTSPQEAFVVQARKDQSLS
jgi:hypothetical protein